MKITKRRVDAVRKVINDNYWIKDRVEILSKRGYTIKRTKVHSGGVGNLSWFPRSVKLQIGAADMFDTAAAVIFEPEASRKVFELNNRTIINV